MPRRLPTDLARAGAMTTANSTGVSRGTTISRGVWALRAKRRRASVARAPSLGAPLGAGATIEPGNAGAVVIAAMVFSLGTGSGGEAVAGETEVDIVERGRPGADPGGGQVKVGHCRHRLFGRAVVQRHGEGGAHREGVVSGDPAG